MGQLTIYRFLVFFATLSVLADICKAQDNLRQSPNDLLGHWPLSHNSIDHSGNNIETVEHGNWFFGDTFYKNKKVTSAQFNGVDTWLEIPSNPRRVLKSNNFTISTWIRTDSLIDNYIGDIISQYDPSSRNGFHLSIKSNFGASNVTNKNQLVFGINDDVSSEWLDYGRPGKAIFPFSMISYKGELYVGITDSSFQSTGQVYRYAPDGVGENKWIDCGFLDSSNTVTSLAEFKGSLYAATGHYRTSGSSLPLSENTTNGGRIFRYTSPNKWIDCGKLPDVEAIFEMIEFHGELYASSLYSKGFFRYKGGKKWEQLKDPGHRIQSLATYRGHLYATSYDLGHVFRYDGESWEDCGQFGDPDINTQGYGFAVYEGSLYVSTWAEGRVYRFDGINEWVDVGRLGKELEVMGILVHNGRLLGGTLPSAEIYAYQGDTTWVKLAQLDKTPNVKYRRAWSMVEHDGKVFSGTLPSGHIYGFDTGKSVMSSKELPSGWVHIVAIKSEDHLQLFVNGKLVAKKEIADLSSFDLNNTAPLKIGFGSNNYFQGQIKDLRFFRRALSPIEIKKLCTFYEDE